MAGLLIDLDSDPVVMRYLSVGESTPPEEIRDRVLPAVLAGYDRSLGRYGLFAAEDRTSGDFLGWLSLRPEPRGPLDDLELGYRLRQAAWGRGYAS